MVTNTKLNTAFTLNTNHQTQTDVVVTLDISDKHQIDAFTNELLNNHPLNIPRSPEATLATAQHIQKIIRERLPVHITKKEAIKTWILKNWHV